MVEIVVTGKNVRAIGETAEEALEKLAERMGLASEEMVIELGEMIGPQSQLAYLMVEGEEVAVLVITKA